MDDFGHGNCAAAPATPAAVVSHQVGNGRTLFFGFDMARSIMHAPADERLRAMPTAPVWNGWARRRKPRTCRSLEVSWWCASSS
ncbi:hypothetical protein LP420_39885 [Massilia sp. B-10]|nr:hypothetical protein LP420_39885 [Massilia sp. B-10]